MCFSLKSSIISYSLGIISAIFAFFTRQIVLGSLRKDLGKDALSAKEIESEIERIKQRKL